MSQTMVLCYHAVSDRWAASEAVTCEQLERQLHYLVRRGWRGVTFGEAVGGRTGSRTMAITFDDALASVRRLAFPILSSLGLTATVFAPTDYVTDGRPCLWSGLDQWAGSPYESELTPMSWDELGELAEHGWEVGSHTCSHPRLTRLDDASLARELEEPRLLSAERLGHPFCTVAYPYGDVDVRVAAAARRAGYDAGAALAHHLRESGCYEVPRTGVYRRDPVWRFVLKTAWPVRGLRASPAWRG